MRFPYVVGRWVRGKNHYGRQRLIEYLLTIPDNAVWVVGTRRMGKTSLLRQLELTVTCERSEFVPIFWDLQGCESSKDLSDELQFAVEDTAVRMPELGLEIADYVDQDALTILRLVARSVEQQGRKVLLLIDEAEALLTISRQEPAWLARLRKAFQDPRIHTVMTATKLLLRLNDEHRDWVTSPFLFGFSLVNLWSLDPTSSSALVCQSQTSETVHVDETTLAHILEATNRHPYLIQFLCQRLFTASGDHGVLRPIEDDDLQPDHLLAGFFQVDFQHLSNLERRLLLRIAEESIVDHRTLVAGMPDVQPTRVRAFLYGMHKLGYLRHHDGAWSIGNEFLRRWIRDNILDLLESEPSQIDDHRLEELLSQGVRNELAYLNKEVMALENKLQVLQEQRRTLNGLDAHLDREIAQVCEFLAIARREVHAVHSALLVESTSSPI